MAKDTIKKKDQIGILAENMNSQFGLVMESFSVLNKKIDGVDERLTNFQIETSSKFETVFNYLSTMEPQGGKIENLDKRVTILEKQSVTSK